MNRLRSPLWYYGSKSAMVGKILPLLPNCPRYVEPFGGGATILLARKPAAFEVYNDIDGDVVNFFRVLANRKQFKEFYRCVAVLPYSRSLFNECQKTMRNEKDPVKRAVMWFVLARQSFLCSSQWGPAITLSRRHMSAVVSSWLSGIEHLPEVHRRLQRVQIEQIDWRVILDKYDMPSTLFYCDPPYLLKPNTATAYKYNLTKKDHQELVERLLRVQGKVVLSGYSNPIYTALEDTGWKRTDFKVLISVGRKRDLNQQDRQSTKRRQPRIESVWQSPSCFDKLASARLSFI